MKLYIDKEEEKEPEADESDESEETDEPEESDESDESESSDDQFSFLKELKKPSLSEGMLERNDVLFVVLRRICTDADEGKQADLIEKALDEFKGSVLALFEDAGYDVDGAGLADPEY